MHKIPVTVIMPVKNEESNLPHCLKILSDFEQVMVIDSGSTDRTVEIAQDFGAEIHQFKWNGHFPKKRNWALRNLSFRNEWILFLDADEFLTPDFIAELRKKIEDPAYVGYIIKFNKYFMGKKLTYGDVFEKVALVKVGAGEYEEIKEDAWSHLDMEIHEHLIVKGKCGVINSKIDHNDFKNLEAYINRHNSYSTWEANRFLNLKSETFQNLNHRQKLKYQFMKWGFLPYVFFFGSYILKWGFLDGAAGFYFAMYKMHYFLQIQTKIMEQDNYAKNTSQRRSWNYKFTPFSAFSQRKE